MMDEEAATIGQGPMPARRDLRRLLRAVLVTAALATPMLAFGDASEVEASARYRIAVQGEAQPGSLVTIAGTGFRAGTIVQARWDVPATRLRFISVDHAGRFTVQVRIPGSTSPGMHTMAFGYVSAAAVARYRASSRLIPMTTTAHVRFPVVLRLTVPASIDATCATNASPALNAWIAAQPNGSTLVFPAGSCYQLGGDAGLNLAGRTGLTLVGTGSTLQLRTSGATNFSSAFFLQSSTRIVIRGFAVDGGNTATGTTAAGSAVNEHLNAAVDPRRLLLHRVRPRELGSPARLRAAALAPTAGRPGLRTSRSTTR